MQSADAGYMIHHLATALARQNDQILLERLGIGFSQFKILMVLERNPHIQQKSIAQTLGQTEASISRQVKLMHQEGLLRTTINPDNRRRHITAPTAKGSRLAAEAAKVLNRYHAPMFERLDGRQQKQLMEILGQMHRQVCQAGKSGACDHPFSL